MPQWVLLSLLAGVVGSVSNLLYRITLKEDQDAAISSWVLQLSRLVVATIFVLWLGISFDFRSVLILVLLGCIDAAGMYTYMRMHAASALSISIIIQRSRILWIAILAAIFVGETFTPVQVVGLITLFTGVIAVAAPHKLRSDTGVQFAYISAVLFSITTVMIKATISAIPPAVQVLGLALPSTILFPFLIGGFGRRLRQFSKQHVWAKIGAALTNVMQLFFSIYALAVGPAAKSSAIYQGTLVLSVFAGIILLGEREDLWRKFAGSLLVLIGIAAMSL